MSENTPAYPQSTTTSIALSNKAYDVLKLIAQIILPGVGALYFALAGVWGLPDAKEVVGSITAVDVFLGLVLGAMSRSYNNSDAKFDGAVQLVPDEENAVTNANFSISPDALASKDSITLKVNQLPGNDG